MIRPHSFIREIRQDDHSFRSQVRFDTDVLALTAGNGFCTTRLSYSGSRSFSYFHVHTVNLSHLFAGAINHIVIKFITYLLNFDGGAISLRARLPSSARGNCACCRSKNA